MKNAKFDFFEAWAKRFENYAVMRDEKRPNSHKNRELDLKISTAKKSEID